MGHFATLIIDRSCPNNQLAVYADSLPDYEPRAMEILQRMLSKTTVGSGKLTWIKAGVPRQHGGTNDCGIFAGCFTMLYLKGMKGQGLLSDASRNAEDGVGGAVSGVDLVFDGMNSHGFGGQGRSLMLDSLRTAKADWKHPLMEKSMVVFKCS